MYLGSRRVRSAGRTSGSVEVTLPVQLSVLQGIECRLVVRDGARPELVLEPELSATQSFFHDMWEKLSIGLATVDEIGEFSVASFDLALLTPAHAPDRPPLTYADGLAALRERVVRGVGGGAATELDAGREACARVLGALGAAAGQRLGLSYARGLAFGDALALVMTGIAVGWGSEFERSVAHQAFREALGGEASASGLQLSLSPFEDRSWRAAQPGLAQVFAHHKQWQAEPVLYELARDRWIMALTLEAQVTGGATTGRQTRRFFSP